MTNEKKETSKFVFVTKVRNNSPVVLRKTDHEEVKLHSNGHDTIQVIHNNSESGLKEQGFRFNDHISTGTFNEIFIDGAHIFYNNLLSNKTRVVNAEINNPVMQMYFLLEGNNCITNKSNKILRSISQNQHNLFFRQSFKGEYHLEGKRFQNFGIQLSEKFFNRLIDINSKSLENIFEGIQKRKEFIQLANRNLHITPEIKAILMDVKNNKRTGFMKRLFLESKIIELFMLQVEQAESANNGRMHKFRKEEIDRLYDAKLFIEQNMLQEFTLLDLSRRIGLNDFKLKKGFKKLFGTTVFSYLNELKMDYAKRLILDEKKPIYEVSMILGYSEPHHFSVAFKRRFGYSPGVLK
jgi:AraC-like DNA-binding protein